MYRARLMAALSLATTLVVGGSVLTQASASPQANARPAVATKAAAAATWRPQQGAFFTKPRSAPKRMWMPERHVIAAINHTPRGATIRMSMYSFDRMPVAMALVHAKWRGVHVQVLVNAHERPKAQRRLKKAIGGNRHHSQFIYQCVRNPGHGVAEGSCRGAGDILHTKFITFSTSGAAHHVVMFGSLNMKANGSINQYNDLYVKNDATGLYGFYYDLFNSMRNDRPVAHPYMSRSLGPKWHAWAYPFYGQVTSEPIYQALQQVRCTGATNTWNGHTKIRVNMHAWDSDRGKIIAKKLVQLKGQGCDIKAQYGMAGRGVRQILARSTKHGRIAVRSNGYDTDGRAGPDGQYIDLYSHQKLLMIKGRQGNARSLERVYTGSSNWQASGKFGDELIVRITSASNFNQYERNWNWIWNNKTRAVGYMPAGAVYRTTTGRRMTGPMLIDPLSDRSIKYAETQG